MRLNHIAIPVAGKRKDMMETELKNLEALIKMGAIILSAGVVQDDGTWTHSILYMVNDDRVFDEVLLKD